MSYHNRSIINNNFENPNNKLRIKLPRFSCEGADAILVAKAVNNKELDLTFPLFEAFLNRNPNIKNKYGYHLKKGKHNL